MRRFRPVRRLASAKRARTEDGDKTRYSGKGVRKAVANVNGEIAQALVGQSLDQRALDAAMIALDGTPTKARLGANAILGVSMAAMRAEALSNRLPLYRHIGALYSNHSYVLPVPMMNILNGGAHADSSVDFQEFMVMPVGAPSFAEAVRTGAEIFHALRGILKGRGQSTGVGDEGGFAPNLKSNREAVDVVLEAVGKAGFKAGDDVFVALDVASSELWAGDGRCVFKKSGEPDRTSAQMVELYARTGSGKCPDHLHRGRRRGGRLGRVADAHQRHRQPGATRRRRCVRDQPGNPQAGDRGQGGQQPAGEAESDRHGHRNARRGEDGPRRWLRDDHVAPLRRDRGRDHRPDMAVGTAAGQIKTGSASRTDRLCKYNQLLRIEEELGSAAVYAGRSAIHALSVRK